MRRTPLLAFAAFALALLAAAFVTAAGASARTFAFPTVSRTLGQKPKIGRAHGHAPTTLKTKDVVAGTGRVAKQGATIVTNDVGVLYRGGKEFDNTWDLGQPFAFPLGRGQVIAGWEKGIKGMRVGGRRILVVPPRLAYGAQGSPPSIPANATLIFVVDLVDVLG
jgi:FKBP-type peptidyl-prolyl cis-trans isomerase